MKTVWKYQDAVRQFGKLFKSALSEGPQYITQEGIETVVIISINEYEQLVSESTGFKEFLLNCPKIDEPLQTERLKDFPRDIDL